MTAADKLHNCLDILADVERDGPGTLERFNGKTAGTLWYYAAMSDLLCHKLPTSALTARLDQAARALHGMVGVAFPAPKPER